MKTTHTYLIKYIQLIVLIFTLIGCEKNNDIEIVYSDIKIISISGIGEFNYKGEQIASIGLENFVYNDSGQLKESRIYHVDTIYDYNVNTGEYGEILLIEEDLEKYSYIWEHDHIVGRFDSIMHKTIKDEEIYNLSLETNVPGAEYYYTGKRLDSIIYLRSINDRNVSKSVFEYDKNGNIKKVIEFGYFDFIQPFPTRPLSYESVTEFTGYDNHPNPFNLIFNKCGVVLNKLEGRNISRNNPNGSTTKVKFRDDWMEVTSNYDYEYGSNGLPVKIIINKGTMGEKFTEIEYD